VVTVAIVVVVVKLANTIAVTEVAELSGRVVVASIVVTVETSIAVAVADTVANSSLLYPSMLEQYGTAVAEFDGSKMSRFAWDTASDGFAEPGSLAFEYVKEYSSRKLSPV
jgi:hypothetical protein